MAFAFLFVASPSLGQQTEEDKRDALLSAAQQGVVSAQYELGRAYDLGTLGFEWSQEAAMFWFRKAAELGHADAQFALGAAHRDGRGVARDLVLAQRWLSKAAGQGHVRAIAALRALDAPPVTAAPLSSAAPANPQQPSATPTRQTEEDTLRNADVLTLIKAGLATEVVCAKIRTSSTQFDTSTAALVALKEAGVPDAVLLEMVQRRGTDTQSAVPVRELTTVTPQAPDSGDAATTPVPSPMAMYVAVDDLEVRALDELTKALRQGARFTLVRRPEEASLLTTLSRQSTGSAAAVPVAGMVFAAEGQKYVVTVRERGTGELIYTDTETIGMLVYAGIRKLAKRLDQRLPDLLSTPR